MFSAVQKSSHFQDLKFYYFHNCIYDHLYLDATNSISKSVKTEDVIRLLNSDYKAVFIGDAAMAPSELCLADGNIFWDLGNELPGITWLERFARKFSYNVWLNPVPERIWERVYGS